MKINCLDYGSVEVMNSTGDGDLLVVNAARCSFDKHHNAFKAQQDEKLIHYLARHEHVLPFRHPVCTLRIHSPIFVLRQLGKHQVGFSWSEVSRRYITTPPKFHHPEDWRLSAENVKQGSADDVLQKAQRFVAESLVMESYDAAHTTYLDLLEEGVCPEQARMVLPQSMYTTTVVTGSLLGWFHLYKLRTDSHTQRETQEYARAVGEVMSQLFPISWEALCEHS